MVLFPVPPIKKKQFTPFEIGQALERVIESLLLATSGEGVMTLSESQKKLIQRKYKILIAGGVNGTGKTLAAVIKVLHFASQLLKSDMPTGSIMIIVEGKDNIDYFYQKIVEFLKDHNLYHMMHKMPDVANPNSINAALAPGLIIRLLVYNSTINPRKILGSEVPLIVIDEGTYMNSFLINELLKRNRYDKPLQRRFEDMTKNPCQIVITGNNTKPNNDIFEMIEPFTEAWDEDNMYNKVKDNPPEVIWCLRQAKTRKLQIFAQEVEGSYSVSYIHSGEEDRIDKVYSAFLSSGAVGDKELFKHGFWINPRKCENVFETTAIGSCLPNDPAFNGNIVSFITIDTAFHATTVQQDESGLDRKDASVVSVWAYNFDNRILYLRDVFYSKTCSLQQLIRKIFGFTDQYMAEHIIFEKDSYSKFVMDAFINTLNVHKEMGCASVASSSVNIEPIKTTRKKKGSTEDPKFLKAEMALSLVRKNRFVVVEDLDFSLEIFDELNMFGTLISNRSDDFVDTFSNATIWLERNYNEKFTGWTRHPFVENKPAVWRRQNENEGYKIIKVRIPG